MFHKGVPDLFVRLFKCHSDLIDLLSPLSYRHQLSKIFLRDILLKKIGTDFYEFFL